MFRNILLLYALNTVWFLLISSYPENTWAGDNLKSSYGEPCNRTLRCDRKAWLGCFAGRCDCLKGEEMVYEGGRGKCASRAGERCKYSLEHPDGSKSYEFTDCVENASCTLDGFCNCNDNFYENAYGTCNASRGYFQSCNEEVKCSTKAHGFECLQGLCSCNPRCSVYSLEENQCVGLVGHKCVGGKCTPNANCSLNGICLCKDGFFQNSFVKCSRKYGIGHKCSLDAECEHREGLPLKCISGECRCDPSVALYGTAKMNINNHAYSSSLAFSGFAGEAKTQCLGKADSECIERRCAPGSYCSYKALHDGFGTCRCRPGFTKSAAGTCGRGFQTSCDETEPCMDGLVCDSKARQCACRYRDQEYSTELRQCRSKVNGPCGEDLFACVSNARCELFSELSSNAAAAATVAAAPGKGSKTGFCICKPGFVVNEVRGCDLEFGQSCNATSVCDSVAELSCINNICQCSKFGKYSSKFRSCQGLAGSPCTVFSGSSPHHNKLMESLQCVENAFCHQIHPSLVATCACKPGFILTENYTCVPPPETVPVLSFPPTYDDDEEEEEAAALAENE